MIAVEDPVPAARSAVARRSVRPNRGSSGQGRLVRAGHGSGMGKRRLDGLAANVTSPYAKGLTTGDIIQAHRQIRGAEVWRGHDQPDHRHRHRGHGRGQNRRG